MFSFFIPTSKVQKDRSIMRETDARMAKYSRRGLIFNFFAYLICLVGGRFVVENRDLTITLTIGLLLITLLRGFFLFRFDQLYPRAPQRWRNSYFVATLLGALWWAVILVSVTLKLDMSSEAPLLWLYTVVFFSTTAHAFAPYQKFLSYYQFVGLVPAAVAALFVNDFTAYLYGILLLVFYLVLTHQCRLISENYWERLEAAYALARKTQSIEEEKRDTRASVQLNKEFLGYLRADLESIFTQSRDAIRELDEGTINRAALRKVERAFKRVFYNVNDFSSVQAKELVLQNKVFNVRHELQNIVADFIDDAEIEGIQIETSLSPTLPMRLKGDASRLSQILKTLIGLSIKSLERGVILIEVEFLREYETAGELYINISSYSNTQKRRFFSDDSSRTLRASLAYAVAKGLAELMNGNIEASEISREGLLYRLDAKFDIAEMAGHLDFHKNSFRGRSVMLIHKDLRIVDIKRRELHALGFEVFTESQYKRAQQQLANSYKEDKPIECVLYFLEEGETDAREFNQALVEHPDLKFAHQLIAASERQQRLVRNQGFQVTDFVHFVSKPAGLFELETAFRDVYMRAEEGEVSIEDGIIPVASEPDRHLLLFSHHKDADSKVKVELEGMGLDVNLITDEAQLDSQYQNLNPVAALVDCDEELNFTRVVDAIRELEQQQDVEFYMPIIGISSSSQSWRSAAYELGVDDFIDLSGGNRKLRKVLENWLELTARPE